MTARDDVSARSEGTAARAGFSNVPRRARIPVTMLAIALAAAPSLAQSVDTAAASEHPAVRAAASACRGDYFRLCFGVAPGEGRVVRCLAARIEALTPECRAAMERARDALIADGLAKPAAHESH